MAKKPIKWKGELATPIKWTGPRIRVLQPTIVCEPSAALQRENAARYDAAMVQALTKSLHKLELLKQHFAVPDGEAAWPCLALALALYADIPGFRIQHQGEGRGRKADTWLDGDCIGLVRDVDHVKTERNFTTDMEALRVLVGEPSIYNRNKRMRNSKTKEKLAASLNSRLTEARRRITEKKLESFTNPNSEVLRFLFAQDSPLRKITLSGQ